MKGSTPMSINKRMYHISCVLYKLVFDGRKDLIHPLSQLGDDYTSGNVLGAGTLDIRR